MDRWSILVLLFILSGCQNLEIDEMKVPAMVELGEDAELQCGVALGDGENTTGLEMHWYFQAEGAPVDKVRHVFQWLLGKRPEVVDKKGSNLTCSEAQMSIEKDDCGLVLLAPGPHFSGNYTCAVSTFASEKRKTLPLIVYTSTVEPEIFVESPAEGAAEGTSSTEPEGSAAAGAGEDSTSAPAPPLASSWFVCNASGAHPEPDLKLFVNGEEVTSEEEEPLEPDDTGFYNPSSRVALNGTAEPVELSCELVYPSLPDIEPKTASYTHNEGEGAVTSSEPAPSEDDEEASAATDGAPLPDTGAAQTSIASLFFLTFAAVLII